MRRFAPLLLLCICFTSCKNNKGKASDSETVAFDTTGWQLQEGDGFPLRAKMLPDLIKNVHLHGLNKEQLFRLLGQPGYSNNGYLYYNISKKTFPGLPVPFAVKTLVIKLTKDSTVEWRKIHN